MSNSGDLRQRLRRTQEAPPGLQPYLPPALGEPRRCPSRGLAFLQQWSYLFGPGEGVCALWDDIPTLKPCFFVPASGCLDGPRGCLLHPQPPAKLGGTLISQCDDGGHSPPSMRTSVRSLRFVSNQSGLPGGGRTI